MILMSVGFDYTFKNSLFLQAEYLYSSNPLPSAGFIDYYAGPLTVKQLAFTDHTLFASASYPITPLLQATLAGMYFPNLKGAFAGPSLSYNAFENVYLALFLQYFSAEMETPVSGGSSRQNITLGFLRFKWNWENDLK